MENQPTIIVYTTNGCLPCQNIKKFLRENDYEFEEKNIREPINRKKVISMGYFRVPIVIIDGIEIEGDNIKEITRVIEELLQDI